MANRRTKILATLGPATDDPRVLSDLVAAGADAVRISLAHGHVEDALRRVAAVRSAATAHGREVGVLIDLPGPKLRVQPFPAGGARLVEGQEVTISGGLDASTGDTIGVEDPDLVARLREGDRVALGDGGVTVVIDHVAGGRARAVVRSGGALQGRPGLHLPAALVSLQSPTPEDLRLLDAVLPAGVDAVAISFVRAADDLARARQALGASPALLVAKVETQEAVDALDDVVAAADVIMVARGDLGVRCRLEDVPHYQKRIIRSGIFYGRPVITATQMLESMIHAPVPTRAEVSDVANAVFDGTSVLMLSGETAIGQHPALVVRTMASVAARAELEFDHDAWADRVLDDQPARLVDATPVRRVTEAASAAAYRAALDAGAVAIVACTNSGLTARVVARFRPPVPILAVSPSLTTQRQLAFSWGVQAVHGQLRASTDEIVWFAVKEAVERGVARADDVVVVVAGDPVDPAPATDTMRLVRVR